MGDYWTRLRVRLAGVSGDCDMRDCERETIRLIERIATGELRGRHALTEGQCQDLCRIYEADPLYCRHAFAPEFAQALGRYANRKKNVQMNALCMTYVVRAAEGLVVLNVGKRMAYALLALLDLDVRERALRLAGKWRRQREKAKDEQEGEGKAGQE